MLRVSRKRVAKLRSPSSVTSARQSRSFGGPDHEGMAIRHDAGGGLRVLAWDHVDVPVADTGDGPVACPVRSAGGSRVGRRTGTRRPASWGVRRASMRLPGQAGRRRRVARTLDRPTRREHIDAEVAVQVETRTRRPTGASCRSPSRPSSWDSRRPAPAARLPTSSRSRGPYVLTSSSTCSRVQARRGSTRRSIMRSAGIGASGSAGGGGGSTVALKFEPAWAATSSPPSRTAAGSRPFLLAQALEHDECVVDSQPDHGYPFFDTLPPSHRSAS